MGAFDSLMEKYGDDLNELKQKFEASGLGKKLDSWIGTGDNEPITADEVKQGLGQDKIDEIAQTTGRSADEVADELSRELPRAVNAATPEGTIPSATELRKTISGTFSR
jgi:uncharacterized protein YidB (DUF937 family)